MVVFSSRAAFIFTGYNLNYFDTAKTSLYLGLWFRYPYPTLCQCLSSDWHTVHLLFLHAKVYAIFNEYIPYDSLIMKINKLLSLERSLVCGLLLMITSISLTICSLATWRDKEFLFLEPNETMRLVIPAVTQ